MPVETNKNVTHIPAGSDQQKSDLDTLKTDSDASMDIKKDSMMS